MNVFVGQLGRPTEFFSLSVEPSGMNARRGWNLKMFLRALSLRVVLRMITKPTVITVALKQTNSAHALRYVTIQALKVIS